MEHLKDAELPCGDSRVCPIGEIRGNLGSIKEDVIEIKENLSEQRELLSNFKVLNEALGTLKSEQFENRKTFGKLFDRVDDLQRTKADNLLRSEIDMLQRTKAETSEITKLSDRIEDNTKEIADRPSRREIISLVTVISVIIGILFSAGNLLLSVHEKKEAMSDVKAAIHEAMGVKKNGGGQP